MTTLLQVAPPPLKYVGADSFLSWEQFARHGQCPDSPVSMVINYWTTTWRTFMVLCSPRYKVLTHWGWDNMAAIFQTIISNTFSWMITHEFWLKFHWGLFLWGPINNIPALVPMVAWRRPGDKPLSEPMMARLPTHIYVTRPQWVNS